jgi:hypothetical protein
MPAVAGGISLFGATELPLIDGAPALPALGPLASPAGLLADAA